MTSLEVTIGKYTASYSIVMYIFPRKFRVPTLTRPTASPPPAPAPTQIHSDMADRLVTTPAPMA